MRKTILTILLVTIVTVFIHAQFTEGFSVEQDTVEVYDAEVPERIKKGSIFSGKPGKAALYSLVIPGAGQIYNKSYLRAPFVWAAIGGMGYLVYTNTRDYKCFRDGYIQAIDGNGFDLPSNCTSALHQSIPSAQPATIRSWRDKFDKNRQLSIIGLSLVWIANSVDAYVNAHLKEFDVSDDLSFRPHIKPNHMSQSVEFGLVFSF